MEEARARLSCSLEEREKEVIALREDVSSRGDVIHRSQERHEKLHAAYSVLQDELQRMKDLQHKLNAHIVHTHTYI